MHVCASTLPLLSSDLPPLLCVCPSRSLSPLCVQLIFEKYQAPLSPHVVRSISLGSSTCPWHTSRNGWPHASPGGHQNYPLQSPTGAARSPLGGRFTESTDNLRQTVSSGTANSHTHSHSHNHSHSHTHSHSHSHTHPLSQTFSVDAGHHKHGSGSLHPGHPKEIELVVAAKTAAPHATKVAIRSPTGKRGRTPMTQKEEEGAPFLASSQEGSLSKPQQVVQLTTAQVAACALFLAPIWLLTEYLSNAALSMTSVASTTILSSTSGLFTLLFGVTIGGDNLTAGKLMAALVSIIGVMMTELGKSSASDDSKVFGDADRNPGETAGDIG